MEEESWDEHERGGLFLTYAKERFSSKKGTSKSWLDRFGELLCIQRAQV